MWRNYALASIFRAVYCAQQLASPMVLQLLVASIALEQAGGYRWAVTLAVLQLVGAVCEQLHQDQAWRMGRRARALCTALLYRKASALSTAAMAGVPPPHHSSARRPARQA